VNRGLGQKWADAKVSDCQNMAQRYIRTINNPKGPDPSVLDNLDFLQTQVGSAFQLFQTFETFRTFEE